MANNKDDSIKAYGEVIERLPGGQFRVKLDNGFEILAKVSGKMRKFSIKILSGDTVEVELSPYDMTKGRITYRGKPRTQAEIDAAEEEKAKKGTKGKKNKRSKK